LTLLFSHGIFSRLTHSEFYQNRKTLKSIEVVANILIIIVAVVLVVVLGQRYFTPAQPQRPNVPRRTAPAVGDNVSLHDIDWSQNRKNVLLVLQEGCRFCTESADFYKTLLKRTKDKGVNVVAVLPQSRDEARKYLDKLQLSDLETKQSALGPLDVSGTPTIIVTDDKGKITNV
jgi:thioredoxin-related protein